MARRSLSALLGFALLSLGARPCMAHGDDAAPPLSWVWEPGTLLPILSSGVLYWIGLVRLWRAAAVGSGIRVAEAVSYTLGWLALVIALLSPLHPLGQYVFSAHMGQHEILMLVAAPLLVLGRPLIAYTWALPRHWRAPVAQAMKQRHWKWMWTTLTLPMVAWAIHAVALWTWHIPALFESTLHSELVHALQHLSFLLSALLFWWSVTGARGAGSYGAAVLYVFSTSAHSGLLGALLTFARTLWYPAYAHRAEAWGLTGLQDQQLGGLIMWIPAGMVYVIAGLALMAAWLRRSSEPLIRSAR